MTRGKEGRWEDDGEKKGLDKEHVRMTHGHGPQCGNWLWEQGGGMDIGGQRGEHWDNCNRITIKLFNKENN